MKLLLLALALGVASAFPECGRKGTSSRIVNGKDAGHGEFPWQVSIQYAPFFLIPKQHICGGTLIAPNLVLTAAHCIQSTTPSKYTIKAGEWHIFSGDGTEQPMGVESIVVHENYQKPNKLQNDIALIKLSSSVDLKGAYAGTACLPEAGTDPRGQQDCWLSGWGLTKKGITGGVLPPSTLQKSHGGIWSDSDLKAKWGNMIQPGMIGYGTDTMSACMGDSGGPLVCSNADGAFDIVGVVSWGTGTCSGMPGVFTEVSYFRDWIEKHGN